MGLASSLGLGLAVCLPDQPVIVLDGDGSVLMNLGSLSTMARYSPSNLTHVIFDNESLLSVGGFPTATSTGTNLEGIARESGVERTWLVEDVESMRSAFEDAMSDDSLSVIVAKVEAVGPTSFAMDIGLLENRFEFERHINNLKSD